jgi:hypothetical protein
MAILKSGGTANSQLVTDTGSRGEYVTVISAANGSPPTLTTPLAVAHLAASTVSSVVKVSPGANKFRAFYKYPAGSPGAANPVFRAFAVVCPALADNATVWPSGSDAPQVEALNFNTGISLVFNGTTDPTDGTNGYSIPGVDADGIADISTKGATHLVFLLETAATVAGSIVVKFYA